MIDFSRHCKKQKKIRFALADMSGLSRHCKEQANTAGTSHFIKDIWLEIIYPHQKFDEKKLLRLSRISAIALGVIALITALSIPMIIDVLIYSYTMYTAGVFIPVIGGILWKRATKKGALSAIIGGALVAIVGIITKMEVMGIPVEVYSALVYLGLFIVISLGEEKAKG